jgi:copper(I)-binding protein
VRLQKRRVLTSGVLGLGAALALAGCGAGQITQTDTMLPAVNGALATVGKISLRNAGIANSNTCQQAYAPGSSAPLALTIANDGAQDDELVSVTSANAAGATIDGQKLVVAGSSLVVGPADQAESAAGSTTATPTSSGSPATAATGSKSKIGRASIVLTGLKQVIWPGQLTPVTFVFRNAGPVTVQLPVAAPTKELPNCQTASQQAETGH